MVFFREMYLSPAAPASALLFGNLFLYMPARIYDGNEATSFYGFPQLVLPLLLLFVLFFTVSSMIGARLWRWRALIFTMLLTGLGVAAWVSSSFFIGSRGLLDGRTFSLISDRTHVTINALALLAIGVAPTTYLALPAIHAAYEYKAGDSLREIYEDSIERNSFVAGLAARGYQGFLVNPIEKT